MSGRRLFSFAMLVFILVTVSFAELWHQFKQPPNTPIVDRDLWLHSSTLEKKYDYMLHVIAKINNAILPAKGTKREEVAKRFNAAMPIPGTDAVDYQLMPGTKLHVEYQDNRVEKSEINYEFIDYGTHKVFFTDGGGIFGTLVEQSNEYSEKNLKQAEGDYIIAQQLGWIFAITY